MRRYGAIDEFFAERGESEFRRLEQEIMIDAAASGAKAVATGGGAVLNRKGMNALRKNYTVVYLTAPEDVLESRIKKSNRPLKNDLHEILEKRKPLYERYADYTVDSSVDSYRAFIRATNSPRKNRYDVVLCDVDETLLDFTAASKKSIAETVSAMGLMTDVEKAQAAFFQATGEVWKKIERGLLTRDELLAERVQRMSELMGERVDESAFNVHYTEAMRGTRFVLDGAAEFLKKLRERRISCYCITNGFSFIARERIKPLLPYIDGCFISEELGVYKPSKLFFDKVFARIGFPDKERTIVIGDSETSDISGGVGYGTDTCLFDTSGQKTTAADFSARTYDEILSIL